MYRATIRTSTGQFTAAFDQPEQVSTAARMVASGAQVSQGWSFSVSNPDTGANLVANGASVHGMVDVVANLMETMALHMPARTRQPGEGVDVVVPVRLAMHDGQLVDAEDWVRGAIEEALAKAHNTAAETLTSVSFGYNGDVVTLGSAKEDRS